MHSAAPMPEHGKRISVELTVALLRNATARWERARAKAAS